VHNPSLTDEPRLFHCITRAVDDAVTLAKAMRHAQMRESATGEVTRVGVLWNPAAPLPSGAWTTEFGFPSRVKRCHIVSTALVTLLAASVGSGLRVDRHLRYWPKPALGNG